MRRHAVLFAFLFAVLFHNDAHAGAIDVAPISLTLSPKVTSGMLALTNKGNEPVRFHITAFQWEQKADGEMVLTPTKDVVFFPAMMTLNPKEARNLRVGVTVKPGDVERTYRVFIQELPPLALTTEEQASTVRVLTKMGVPVFVEGTSAKPTPSLSGLTMSGQRLTFDVKNTGNAHFRTEKLVVKAKDDSKVIHTQELEGWYVLAKGVRRYDVALPREICDSLKSIDVEMKTNHGAVSASLGNARCTQ